MAQLKGPQLDLHLAQRKGLLRDLHKDPHKAPPLALPLVQPQVQLQVQRKVQPPDQLQVSVNSGRYVEKFL